MSPETSDNRGAHWLAVATRMRNRAEGAEDREQILRAAMIVIAGYEGPTKAIAEAALANAAVK